MLIEDEPEGLCQGRQAADDWLTERSTGAGGHGQWRSVWSTRVELRRGIRDLNGFGAHVLTTCKMDEDGGALHTSDSEGLSEQLEVIFSQQADKRRRASLREDDAEEEERAPSRPSRPHSTRKRTSCFVHAMLEARMQTNTQANVIPEDLYRPADKQSSPTTPDGQAHTQSRLLTKKYAILRYGRPKTFHQPAKFRDAC